MSDLSSAVAVIQAGGGGEVPASQNDGHGRVVFWVEAQDRNEAQDQNAVAQILAALDEATLSVGGGWLLGAITSH